MEIKPLENGVIEMHGTLRLRADLAKLGRKDIQSNLQASYDLRAAYNTTKAWLENPEGLTVLDLDRFLRLMIAVYGIPVEELMEMRLEDLFVYTPPESP